MTATSLTPSPVDFVRDLYDAFGRGDTAYITSRLTTDCVWKSPGEGIPIAGTFTGPDGAAEFFRRLSDMEELLRFEPREYFASGNTVVVLGMEELRSRATGKTAATNWAMVFRFRDGQVCYWESLYDTAAVLKAHTA